MCIGILHIIKLIFRTGRTGRAGRQGTSYTLVRQKESKYFHSELQKAENSEQVDYDMSTFIETLEQHSSTYHV